MEYILTRSKRKTTAIHVRDGYVEVRAPLRTPKRDIDSFVAAKEKWITDKLADMRERAKRQESFCLDYGSLILYRGKRFPIEPRRGTRRGFDDMCFHMPPDMGPERIKDACIQIYRMLARNNIKPRVFAYAEQMSVTPASVKITGAQKQWGCCSRRKRLNISWQLIMADDDLIDYVIVHELAHIIEMNHSARFWAIVEGVLPDYRERKARLRDLEKRLADEDWSNDGWRPIMKHCDEWSGAKRSFTV